MNIHRAAAVALTLFVSAPAFAVDVQPAITADEAETAVQTAIAKAETSLPYINCTPVEFAKVLVGFRYAEEAGLPASVAYTDLKAVKEHLAIKAAYWKSVSAALNAESERLNAEIDEMSRNAHNGVEDAMMKAAKLARVRHAAGLIAADIEADTATIADPAKESNQAILDRKAELCRKLAQLKPARR